MPVPSIARSLSRSSLSLACPLARSPPALARRSLPRRTEKRSQFRAATSDKYEWLDPRWDKSGVRHAIAPKGGEASLEVIEGDFYKLEARDDLEGKFDLCLDRAALTYMPPRVQTQHVAQLKHLLKRGGRMLLMTLEFDGEPKCVCKVKSPDGAGPPWSIREADVHRLFDDDFTVQHLCRESIIGQDPRWEKAKGFKVCLRAFMMALMISVRIVYGT